MAVLHPYELYLMDTFTDHFYFKEVRDAVVHWVETHEAAYQRHMRHPLPHPDHIPEHQRPERTWGRIVLPNILPDKNYYEDAYWYRVNNNPLAFHIGNVMPGNNKKIQEFWDGWMTEEERKAIASARREASLLDYVLKDTVEGWAEGDLSYSAVHQVFGGREVPRRVPWYVLDTSVRVSRYEDIKSFDFYLPDTEFAAPRMLVETDFEGPIPAYKGVGREVRIDEASGASIYGWKEQVPENTTWTRIRRAKFRYIEVPSEGFFPRNEPDDLYSWPEREAQYGRWGFVPNFYGK